MTRSSLAVFLLAAALAGPLAAQPGCPIRREQPVVLTKFELGRGLRGKVQAAAFEQEVSRGLSEALRCNYGLRFLEWLDGSAQVPARGVLQVSMLLEGKPPGSPIRLAFQVIEEGSLREELDLGPAAVLYGAQDSQVPGKHGGDRWKADLKARFRELARNQDFIKDLVRAFGFIPIVESEDLLISQASNVIGLPVGPGRLSAGPKTQVDLELLVRSPEEARSTKTLWVNPCLLRAPEWRDRLQLALVERASEIGQARGQGWSELSSRLASRVPGGTAAFLRSFEWQAPEVCGRYVGPRR